MTAEEKKEKNRLSVKKWREENSERNKNNSKTWYANNKTKELERNKKWRDSNPKKVKENSIKWNKNNPEYGKKYRQENIDKETERMRIWRKNNIEKANESQKNYRKTIPHIVAWRNLLGGTLIRLDKKKEYNTIDLLGYSAIDLKNHISSLFTDGMSWDNHGEWHIDHIKTVISFDKETHPSVVNALSNLRPLWKTTREINGVIYEGNLNRDKH